MTQSTKDPVRWSRRVVCAARHLSPFRQGKMQEPGGCRKGGAAGRFRQSSYLLRPPSPDLLVEDQSGELTSAVQLTCPTRQYHTSACNLVEPARLQTIAHQL